MMLGRFRLEERDTTVATEMLAGLTTFATMAYILFVNADILSAAGMDKSSVLLATALAAGVGSILMGLIANLPFALAPGMGMNAYFSYVVVLGMGIPWRTALAAVFLDGVIFLVLSLLPIRSRIIEQIPFNIKLTSAAGIGLFIAFIGLRNVGLVVDNPATLVSMGHFTAPNLLSVLGLWLMTALLVRRVPAAFLIGILAVTFGGLFVTDPATGAKLVHPQQMVWPQVHDLLRGFGQLDFAGAEKLGFAMIVFTFTFVSLFDTAGTFVGLATKLGWIHRDQQIFEGAGRGLLAESFAIMFGALCGTSTTTTYIESASGIAQGGRTGLTAVITGVLFLFSMLLAPVAGLIPSQATAPVLVLVGFMMTEALLKLDLEDFTEGVPAFLTLIMIPLSFNIANGLICGIISWTVLKVLTGRAREVRPTMWILTILCLISATRLA